MTAVNLHIEEPHDPGTSAVGQLRSHLATSLSGDPAWDLALSRLARGEAALHLAAQICARDNQFWADRADCAYATLVDVTHVRLLPAQAFPKKDRRGWVQLTRPSHQEMLL